MITEVSIYNKTQTLFLNSIYFSAWLIISSWPQCGLQNLVLGEIQGKWIDLSVFNSTDIKHSKKYVFCQARRNTTTIDNSTVFSTNKDFQMILIFS